MLLHLHCVGLAQGSGKVYGVQATVSLEYTQYK